MACNMSASYTIFLLMLSLRSGFTGVILLRNESIKIKFVYKAEMLLAIQQDTELCLNALLFRLIKHSPSVIVIGGEWYGPTAGVTDPIVRDVQK
ncbi:hypothetical protein CASFOL_037368 [Castilleja foliolosa]|uniref:Uncharacterized protein n=1 Tax=Castilleja foliolosa TaxID=1961234 RepID=A0ABD3BNM1_9LAMI